MFPQYLGHCNNGFHLRNAPPTWPSLGRQRERGVQSGPRLSTALMSVVAKRSNESLEVNFLAVRANWYSNANPYANKCFLRYCELTTTVRPLIPAATVARLDALRHTATRRVNQDTLAYTLLAVAARLSLCTVQTSSTLAGAQAGDCAQRVG